MKIFYTIILLTFIQLGFSQFTERVSLKGQVYSDSVKVENVVVFNINSRTGTIIKNEGIFEINSKVYDTLVFSSLMFEPKKIILTAQDFNDLLKIKLKIYANQLKEVKVSGKKLNPISENTQKYVDRQYKDDDKSKLKIKNTYDGAIFDGMDFIRLFKETLKLFKKKNPKQTDFYSDVSFTELVLQKVKYTYFINTLKLKDEEIRLFLVYCENDSAAKDLSRYKTTFELMDFLFNKNKEFMTLKNEIK